MAPVTQLVVNRFGATFDSFAPASIERVSNTRAVAVGHGTLYGVPTGDILLLSESGTLLDRATFGESGSSDWLTYGLVNGYPGLQVVVLNGRALVYFPQGGSSVVQRLYRFDFTGDSITPLAVVDLETATTDDVEWFLLPLTGSECLGMRAEQVPGGSSWSLHAIGRDGSVSGALSSWTTSSGGSGYGWWSWSWANFGDGTGVLFRSPGSTSHQTIAELVVASPTSITRTAVSPFTSSWNWSDRAIAQGGKATLFLGGPSGGVDYGLYEVSVDETTLLMSPVLGGLAESSTSTRRTLATDIGSPVAIYRSASTGNLVLASTSGPLSGEAENTYLLSSTRLTAAVLDGYVLVMDYDGLMAVIRTLGDPNLSDGGQTDRAHFRDGVINQPAVGFVDEFTWIQS